MYAGFNLTFSEDFFRRISNQPSERYHHYARIGRGTLQRISNQKLDDYINRFFNNNTILDANHIQEDWFPCIDADVFISHSHNDKYLVEALAGWLYEDMGVSVFIDSDVWGYADTLLEQINDKYSNKRWDGTGYVYDHEKCNRVSQHVYIMLLMSIQKMIDNVESVFFLNTENSVNAISGNQISSTYSPWIYSEILCSEIIRKRKKREYRSGGYLNENSSLVHYQTQPLIVNYDLDLDHLIDIDEDDLYKWRGNYIGTESGQSNALDCLYEIISSRG